MCIDGRCGTVTSAEEITGKVVAKATEMRAKLMDHGIPQEVAEMIVVMTLIQAIGDVENDIHVAEKMSPEMMN